MARIHRLTLYLRQRPDEQALYQYLMRKSPAERTALHRAMMLAEFSRRMKKETPRSRSAPPKASRQRAVSPSTPPTTGATASWNQRVVFYPQFQCDEAGPPPNVAAFEMSNRTSEECVDRHN